MDKVADSNATSQPERRAGRAPLTPAEQEALNLYFRLTEYLSGVPGDTKPAS
jgi:hypothetical protein